MRNFTSGLLALFLAAPVLAADYAYFVVTPSGGASDLSVSLSASALKEGRPGKPYTEELNRFLTVKGDPSFSSDRVTWSLSGGTLPRGLKFTSGLISGTPTLEGDSQFELTATYRGEQASNSYTIKIAEQFLQVKKVANGAYASCAITLSDGVVCWGRGLTGLLGNGTTKDSPTPVTVTGLESGVADIAVGAHACAVLYNGHIKCWGDNYYGQLGNKQINSRSTSPVDVLDLPSKMKFVAVGGETTCALSESNAVYCWGSNIAGQTGQSPWTQTLTPSLVPGLDMGVSLLSVGHNHACAVVDSTASCWGSNVTSGNIPQTIPGLPKVSSLTTGKGFTCALTLDGNTFCWGSNSGSLGNGSSIDSPTPVPVLNLMPGDTARIYSGQSQSCAEAKDGSLKCWGYNGNGQIGDGSTTTRLSPVSIQLPEPHKQLAMWGTHSCALTVSNNLYCWGANNYGQLGLSNSTWSSLKPIKVREP